MAKLWNIKVEGQKSALEMLNISELCVNILEINQVKSIIKVVKENKMPLYHQLVPWIKSTKINTTLHYIKKMDNA